LYSSALASPCPRFASRPPAIKTLPSLRKNRIDSHNSPPIPMVKLITRPSPVVADLPVLSHRPNRCRGSPARD
jgi:hypothetical protein